MRMDRVKRDEPLDFVEDAVGFKHSVRANFLPDSDWTGCHETGALGRVTNWESLIVRSFVRKKSLAKWRATTHSEIGKPAHEFLRHQN